MRILITGGTGLIGRHLCKALQAEGHLLTVLSRRPATVAVKCCASAQAMATLEEWRPDRTFDAVINLAGQPIVDEAWTEKRKQALRDSRIALTEELVRCIAAARQKPAVLLSGSAVGYYGNRGDTELDENAGAGDDFAAGLCRDWETAALAAEASGVRVCLLRTGLVLSERGGLLGRMLLPFRLGLGARLGSGTQWMSWVHVDDYVAMVLRLLRDEQMCGPFNMTAPQPVTNTEFTLTLASMLRRPAFFIAPALMLRLAMGERAALLLEGQRVLPTRLMKAGCQFKFPDLASALNSVLNR
ncbi:TIGR01777 family oxidoreductase [Sideroxydans lithotrophicus]|uniref:NAD-dependent epimerase/dehydratase n=1 Tax=Sideroxydans lithotrophicus (strain ES-1) TaxID=580332 RepID=D5CU92_SIDLE|nr:TIGR01777 family oxidoreductase [Sideroxydans lithotrophicus]ADE10427.1 NAD-dependent epimerase/dehydratase [Sideroxydans lithotrophicus ES-1]